MNLRRCLAVAGPALFLGACDFAPKYMPPPIKVPANYKEAGLWQRADPKDAEPRGAWWEIFHDPLLNKLEAQVDEANQTLAAAVASYDEARADAARAASGLFPTVDATSHFSTNKQSANRPLRSAGQPNHYGDNSITGEISYEVDLWGRVRNFAAAGRARAEASAADLETVRLSLHAELARDYFALRGLDQEAKLLSDTVAAYRAAVTLTKTRQAGLISPPIDVSRSETQLGTAQAEVSDVAGRRALREHAIASLVGQTASVFSIPPSTAHDKLPSIPAGIPSELLERRPDIAAEERRAAATDRLIGVAEAAFYPKFTIGLMGGTQDTELRLLSLPNSVWSVGPAISLPIFDGGLRRAELAEARAAFEESAARYRGTVLRAFQEVEDNLALIRWAKASAQSLDTAGKAARKTLDLSLALYRDGAANYLEVVVAQEAELEVERAALAVTTNQFEAAVGLILATGGGWDLTEIADAGPLVTPK